MKSFVFCYFGLTGWVTRRIISYQIHRNWRQNDGERSKKQRSSPPTPPTGSEFYWEQTLWVGLHVYPHYSLQPPVMSSFSAGNLPHVTLWNDFIRFNWKSRKGLREAVSGKTGPNHSMDDDRLIRVSPRLTACISEQPARFCREPDFGRQLLILTWEEVNRVFPVHDSNPSMGKTPFLLLISVLKPWIFNLPIYASIVGIYFTYFNFLGWKS